MKLCLGTVKFGMDYGLNIKKPSLDDSIEMLDFATKNGIDAIDTAYSYGAAEEIIGKFLGKKTISRDKLNIISKLKPDILDGQPRNNWYYVIKENLLESLRRLNTDYLDGYLLHSARYIFDDSIIEHLNRLKKEGYIKKAGVSIYEQAEAEKAVSTETVDAIQIPFSIFDQRLKKCGLFDMPQIREKEIYSRSVFFVQGLIMTDEDRIPEHLAKARAIIAKAKSICKENNISRAELTINFVKQQYNIDYLVFGVDDISQLKENVRIFNNDICKDLISGIAKEFEDIDADLINSLLNKK